MKKYNAITVFFLIVIKWYDRRATIPRFRRERAMNLSNYSTIAYGGLQGSRTPLSAVTGQCLNR